ncbi:MAG: DUF3365 domain-containing protein [Nitrospinaceae bacterium]
MSILLVSLFFAGNAVAALSDDQKKEVGTEVTSLYRAARGVIAKNQKLINDASKGDKGLTADKVIAAAKANYKAATGKDFKLAPKSTLKGQTQAALLAAIKEVMDNGQPVINEKGKGFKGFLPAIFAKQMGDVFNKNMGGKAYIKLTAPKNYVRNRANRPDKWENDVIENQFKKPGYEKNKVFVANAKHKGRPAFRLILPEYYKKACLNCHGEPKGAKDITGGKKEGGKLGELGGAISFVVYD